MIDLGILLRCLLVGSIFSLGGWIMAVGSTTAAQEVHIENLTSNQDNIQSRQTDFNGRISASEAQLSGLTASLLALKEGQKRILDKLEKL